MFVGHFAVGFASKKLAPKTSLAWLILAPLFLDALWPIFLVTGLESVRIDPGNTVVTPLDLHDYPYTHSLVGALVWSVLYAGVYFAWKRDRKVALLLALGVFSHWILDFVTHRPDMPLYPGSATYVGLGLWNSRIGTLVIESAMFIASIAIYVKATHARTRAATVNLAAYVAVLSALYLGNIFGPPPPSVTFIIAGVFVFWLFIPWAHYLDRARTLE